MRNNFLMYHLVLFLLIGLGINSYANNKSDYSTIEKELLAPPTVSVDGTNIIITIDNASDWGGLLSMNGIVWFDLFCNDVFIERYPLAVGRDAVGTFKIDMSWLPRCSLNETRSLVVTVGSCCNFYLPF